jgi:PAS domain S-box-containing protein
LSGRSTHWMLTEFLNTFDLVNKALTLQEKLDLVCQSIINAKLYRRALIAFYERCQGKMCLVELGAAGISSQEIQRIRSNFQPVDEKVWLQKFQPEFRIGRSYFIPAESRFDVNVDNSIPSEKKPNEFDGDWHPDDRLFIPLHDLSGEIIGLLSVDDPFNDSRPKGDSLHILELYANLVSGVINEFMLLNRKFHFMREKIEQANKDLFASEEKYRLIANNIGELVYLQSLDGVFEFVSPSVEHLLGYTVEEYCAIVHEIWIGPSQINEQAETIRESVRQKQFRGIPVYYAELRCKDGRKVIHEIREEIIYREGEKPAVLGVSRDVTERFRLEKIQKGMELDLLNLSKLSTIGMLTSGIAHNLNSPLQAIRGYTEILMKKHPDLMEPRLILKGVEKMTDIISNLMIKARLEQDRHTKTVNLNQLLEQELKFLEADLEYKRNVKRDFQFSKEPLEVFGVYSDFSQSFSAIIRNALDAMWHRKDKQLGVHTNLEDDWIRIDISDTGCGIPSENLSKIFQPFFTTKPLSSERQTSEPGGTGLGLSTAQQLLSRYNATFEVKSVLDQGSTFTIRIPLHTKPSPVSQSEELISTTSWHLPTADIQ